MKKLIMAIILVAMLAPATATAQVFLDDNTMTNNRDLHDREEFGVMVPRENVDYDQWKYVPIGDGWVMLLGLAGAYMFGMRSKKTKASKE